ncbi:MAG: glycosyltransferase [Acidobacteria bacterium]|nr:glycosyltransferase [Acidobacteriota bacterium]
MSTDARVSGKFLEVGGRRFLVKGVTYGTFAPETSGRQYPSPARVQDDFAAMAAAGVNTVRTYTPPPDDVLDAAERHGLRLMIGLPWTQHVAFLDEAALARRVRREVAAAVARLAGHPATLLFAVGNEIPPGVVRWHGAARVEQFLRGLYHDAKAAAPSALLTYANFPPTEYLETGCFDVCAFNVYLHREADLRAYLARLQHVAGARPLLLAEAGADSIREGLDGQARLTAAQLAAAFAEGAAGAVAFAWTDEWWRGGHEVHDWAFGLVDRDRRAKPALASVARAFAEAPFSAANQQAWPHVSVVVCAYNAAETLDDCLRSLQALTYPRLDILVVDDGSTDATPDIARRYPDVTVVSVANGGLAAARNIGLARATGEIVAYTDADVRVDPDWLTYLVQPMLRGAMAGSGGPNVVPADDGWIAQVVARAPGGPTHVLLDDRVAEHVPGCNMAFRKEALDAIGGFNPVYLRAGDDVDICWRLQARGETIGFAPSALVWHHHRATVKGYWRQQAGYGEGETWLEAHHPEKFVGGQMLWRGRIYSSLPFVGALAGRRVNTGVFGTAAFPSVYRTDAHPFQFLPHSPAWMLASTLLALTGTLGLLTRPGEAAWLLLGAGLAGWGTTLVRCTTFAWRSDLSAAPPVPNASATRSRWQYRALIAWLHVLQPLARLFGRLRGLASPPDVGDSPHTTGVPWRPPPPSLATIVASARLQVGGSAEWALWSEAWMAPATFLTALASSLRAARPARRVHVDDGWHADRDLSMAVGRWGWLRIRTLVEEHDRGRCLCRVGARLQPNVQGLVRAALLAVGLVSATSAAIALRWPSASLGAVVVVAMLMARAAWQATRSLAVLDHALIRAGAQVGLVPLRGPSGPRIRWQPAGALQKGQAATAVLMAASTALSALFVWQDLTTRPALPSRPPVVRGAGAQPIMRDAGALPVVTPRPARRPGAGTAPIRGPHKRPV